MRTYLSQQKQKDNKSFSLHCFSVLFCYKPTTTGGTIYNYHKISFGSWNNMSSRRGTQTLFKHGLKHMVIYQSDVFLKQRYKLTCFDICDISLHLLFFSVFAGNRGRESMEHQKSENCFPFANKLILKEREQCDEWKVSCMFLSGLPEVGRTVARKRKCKIYAKKCSLNEKYTLSSEDNNKLLTQTMKTLLNNRSGISIIHTVVRQNYLFRRDAHVAFAAEAEIINLFLHFCFSVLFCLQTNTTGGTNYDYHKISSQLPGTLCHPGMEHKLFKHGLKCMVIYQSSVFLKQRKGPGDGTSEKQKIVSPLQTNKIIRERKRLEGR
ncbi:hypothetical protein CEXT_558681 [Caerostris extrusa]|uniref:Uncharacterized protein n=1 Tax=Caerostris extrusa TaxID=172846 RepID=A0AAV4RZH5_CAEEX|nr:hypothetical protein CEXT_558681 [Caerostris extrusa]